MIVTISSSMALNHGLGAELFQTGTRGDQVLPKTAGIISGCLNITAIIIFSNISQTLVHTNH